MPTISFLEAITSFNNYTEPTLVILPVSLISTGDSLSINGLIVRCTNVLYGTCSGTILEATNLECIIQKLAFRPGNDIKFPPVRNSIYFSIPEFEHKCITSKLRTIFMCA